MEEGPIKAAFFDPGLGKIWNFGEPAPQGDGDSGGFQGFAAHQYDAPPSRLRDEVRHAALKNPIPQASLYYHVLTKLPKNPDSR
jgi:hypothetical protein